MLSVLKNFLKNPIFVGLIAASLWACSAAGPDGTGTGGGAMDQVVAGPGPGGGGSAATGDTITSKVDPERAPAAAVFDKRFQLSYGAGLKKTLSSDGDHGEWIVTADGITNLKFRVDEGISVHDGITGGVTPVDWYKDIDELPIRIVWAPSASSTGCASAPQYLDQMVRVATSPDLPNVVFQNLKAPADTVLEVYAYDTSEGGESVASPPTFLSPPGYNDKEISTFSSCEEYSNFRSNSSLVHLLGKFKMVGLILMVIP